MPTARDLSLQPGQIVRMAKATYGYPENPFAVKFLEQKSFEIGKGPKVRVLGVDKTGTWVEYMESWIERMDLFAIGQRQHIHSEYRGFGRVEELASDK